MSINANMENVVILPNVSPEENQTTKSDDVPKPVAKFFQGEPDVLGATQLFVGINHIFFGIILTITCPMRQCYFANTFIYTGVLFWSGIMCVISGSLPIVASHKPSLGKMKASLVLNIISCIVVGISIVIFAVFFISISGYHYYRDNHCAYYKQSQTCEGTFELQTLYMGIGSTLFLLTALVFSITISTAIFGCKSVCRTSYNDMTVVIYHTTSVNDPKSVLSSDGEVQTH